MMINLNPYSGNQGLVMAMRNINGYYFGEKFKIADVAAILATAAN
jgi:hypothetical protein